jgi:5-methyltetrahydrofolate--homocysteine methyltransferase
MEDFTMSEWESLQTALISGNGDALIQETQKAVDAGAAPHMILNEGLIAGMEVVGEKFKNDELYVPEVINIANNFKKSVEVIKPLIMDTEVKAVGKVLIGTVEGDMHDVGKNIVVLMLEANGFEVIDLGVNVSNQLFIDKFKEHDADVLGMSALLTTTMPHIKEIIDTTVEAGLREKVKIIIGGAPINETFANEVGADAYGHDAIDAVDKIKALMPN